LARVWKGGFVCWPGSCLLKGLVLLSYSYYAVAQVGRAKAKPQTYAMARILHRWHFVPNEATM